jgi:hypothetical protein
VVAVVMTLMLGACSGADGGAESAADSGDTSAASAGGAGDADVAADEQAAEAEGVDGGGVGEGGLALPAATTTSERVIKEGTVTIKVADGEFDAAFAEVMSVARSLGGGVTGSETSTEPDGYTSGSLTVRVPVESYEDLLVGVGQVGEVTNRRITAEDVSAEFVDLEARRRQLRAQEEFYLGLLEETATVDDAVRVRQKLDRIQTDIERITGRLTFLEDRTSFSTLTVELFEPGAPLPENAASARGLARYWETGLDALVTAVGTMIVVGLGALPLALVVGAVVVVIRAVRRRPGTPDTAPAQPSA